MALIKASAPVIVMAVKSAPGADTRRLSQPDAYALGMTGFSTEQLAVEWTRPLRQAILRPNLSLEQLADHEPPGAYAVGAFDEGRLVSVGFVAPDGTPGGWRIRGMATSPEVRGRGAGAAVLESLVAYAVGNGATRVWCNARTPAKRFYERGGFVAVSEEFEIEGIGPHYVMELRPAGS